MSMPPIFVADLFPEITCRLLDLLRSLSREEWDLPTVSSQRTVTCLDVFMRAVPFTYRNVEAAEGTSVTITVTGEAGGNWHIQRRNDHWVQIAKCSQPAKATVTMDQNVAWKLVTKRRSREAIRQTFPELRIQGDQSVGLHALDMVSVMA